MYLVQNLLHLFIVILTEMDIQMPLMPVQLIQKHGTNSKMMTAAQTMLITKLLVILMVTVFMIT